MKSENSVNVFVFKVLSNEVRLAIIEALLKAPMNVNEICEEIHEEQPRVSHELHCLAVCGFVYSEREGKKMVYELNKDTITPIIEAANKHAKLFSDKIRGCEILSDIRKMTVK
jgi:DNA-binding transcriptional ArsR family regulator